MLLRDLFIRTSERNRNKIAYINNHLSFTWSDINRRVNQLSAFLQTLGIKKGDRVAYFGLDSHQQAEVMYASAKTGFIRVGVNWRYGEREVRYILKDSGAKVLFVDQKTADLGVRIAKECNIQFVIGVGDGHGLAYDYETSIRLQPTVDLVDMGTDINEEDILALCYTTGSTGLPKGAIWTNRNVISSLVNGILHIGLTKEDVWLHALPAAGVPIMSMLLNCYWGNTNILMSFFEPEHALRLIQEKKVTTTLFVPTMIQMMTSHPKFNEFDVSSLRLITYGSAPMSPANIVDTFKKFNCDLQQWYGSTENTGAWVSFLEPEDHHSAIKNNQYHILASCGRPAAHIDIKIVDEHGKKVPDGCPGEILIKGDVVIPGYWKDEEKTKETIRGGWLYSGDIGQFDENGRLYLLDRVNFRMKTGAYNVYPIEIENVINEHPSVAEVCVVGIPDEKWGEAILAEVRLKSDEIVTESEIIYFCKNKIASYKVPKQIIFVTDFPRGATGKLLKLEVKNKYKNQSQWSKDSSISKSL
jgi:acyl-CoA synthetase (AMP-forming)/AMP-acid ligase II